MLQVFNLNLENIFGKSTFCRFILLWPPYGIVQAVIFSSCGFFFLYYVISLAYSQLSHIGCLPYFHTWCGPSAILECRSETCCTCTRLGEKQDSKNSPSGHHCTTLSGCVFATKACIDDRKKHLLNSNVSSICPRIYIFRSSYLLGKFCEMQNSICIQDAHSYIDTVTARHSSSGCEPNFAMWCKEWN